MRRRKTEMKLSGYIYHEEPAGVIYCGDCLKILPLLSDNSVDLVLTDPPYKIHAGKGGGCFGDRDHLVKTGGFTDIGCSYSFLQGMSNWFCFCSRLQLRTLLKQAEQCKRFNLLAWCKPNPVPTCNNKYLPDIEFIVHAYESNHLFGEMNLKSCFMVHPCGQKVSEHPNEKPLKLIRKLIQLGTQNSQLILDPFLGSGTTAVAAKQLGRNFIGIEIEENYCAIAVERLKQEVLSL